jgi:hypothetical protein
VAKAGFKMVDGFGAVGGGRGNAWFNEELERKVGNGLKTSFWHDKWRGGVAFKIKYPRLFSLSNQQDSSVGELFYGGRRGFNWRRRFFVWEESLLNLLIADLEGFVPSLVKDSWKWKLEGEGGFSVKSLYKKLDGVLMGADGCPEEERKAFTQIWKSGAPSKVVAFSWKLLLDRIPSKGNLEIRPDESPNYLWCVSERETSTHLFLHCEMARGVWLRLMRWKNHFFLIPPNLFIHWECWSAGGYHKKSRRGWRLIWHATIWVIWKARNDRLFNNVVKEVEELVDDIQVLSWWWVLGRTETLPCLFYEWVWCPKECLQR